MVGPEIERQFLCGAVAPATLRSAHAVHRIRQGYLTAGDPAVRVRSIDGAFRLTVKSGKGLVREEVEVELPEADGRALMAMAGDRNLRKIRHRIGRWEVDVFEGKLEGLILAEAELVREDEPLPPVPEGLEVLREVTGSDRFRNQALAGLSRSAASELVAVVRGSAG